MSLVLALALAPADTDHDALDGDLNAYGNTQILSAMRESGWGCGDGFVSHPLPDGRTLWLYDDTVTADGRFVRNAAATTVPRGDGSIGYEFHGGHDGHGFLRTGKQPDEEWYWPLTPLPQVQQDFVHVVATRVARQDDGEAGFRFRPTGSRIITLRYADGDLRRVGTAKAPQIAGWGGKPIVWGAATMAGGRRSWMYGVARQRDPATWGHAVYIARIDNRRLAKRRVTGFEVRTTSGWRPAEGVPVGELRQVGADFSTVFAATKRPRGHVVAAVKTHEFMGRSIDKYRAAAPGKRFRKMRQFLELPEVPGALTYWVKVHPELPAPPKKVWASSNNSLASGSIECQPTMPGRRPLWFQLPAYLGR